MHQIKRIYLYPLQRYCW